MAKPLYNCDNTNNKTFILVKLTDSSLNAIEKHLSSNVQALPSILFKSGTNNGILSFPQSNNVPHPEENSGGPTFSFNLSNVEAGGPQGSFECLKQSESRNFKSLGSIQYKMQIHASEDSYERTKERMAESQNESKKYCTKVIKGIGSIVGRRSKVKKMTGQAIVNHSKEKSTSDSGGGGGGNIGIGNGGNGGGGSQPHPPHQSHQHQPPHQPPHQPSHQPPHQSHQPPPHQPHQVPSGSKVTLACNPELMKKSLRERVIHLLALRPYKKPELLARLNKEGIKEKDKKNLSQLFHTISKLKENAYNLAPHAWNEVQVDSWPFYTPEQRELVRKRKTIDVQQRSSTCVPSSDLPSSKSSSSSSSNNNNNNNINNINNINNNNINVSTPSTKRPLETWSSVKRQRLNQDLLNDWSMKPRSPKPKSFDNSASMVKFSGSMVNISNSSTPNSSPDSGTGSNDGNLSTISSKSLSSINCELPDYAIKYVEITSDSQLRRYKEEFNREYKEYRRLHRNIDLVAKRFTAFEVKLKSLPEGSEEWNRTLDEIFKEYDAVKKDYKFMESKRRAAYLHNKLSHIKKLIQQSKN